MITFHQLIQTNQKKLAHVHPDTASFEIWVLIEHIFSIKKATLLQRLHDPVTNVDLIQKFESYVEDRCNHKPLDLIIGNTEFCGKTYHVMPAVLIPRPETEYVVQYALQKIAEHRIDSQSQTIIECGFGTGIISIECALTYSSATIYAYDISKEAYTCATKNAANHNVKNVTWICDDFFNGDWKNNISLNEPFFFISNPPYISAADLKKCDRSVTDYEPTTALLGGPDGLLYYNKFFKELKDYSCYMILEVGINQQEPLTNIMTNLNINSYEFINDVQGIPRILGVNLLKK